MPDNELVKGLIESAAGEWAIILSLVFGGCCSNVWALEAVLKGFPNAGTFLTFAQFLYVTIQTISSQLYFPPSNPRSKEDGAGKSWVPRIRKRQVPIRRWLVQVFFFLGISLMNNYAFGLKIPVTVHIIFRSGGLCVSMLTGYMFARKRYSFAQILAGVVITVGIVLATISAPRRRSSTPKPIDTNTSTTSSSSTSTDYLSENMQYAAGILVLATALFMSACLGIFQEETYRRYGKQWREGLFYCHFLSLPFFIPLYSSLSSTWSAFAMSIPVTLFAIPTPTMLPIQSSLLSLPDGSAKGILQWRELMIPSALGALLLNVITQGLCIRGVNRLTARVNSTTVNLVLTVRKAVSLGISVWYYGSGLNLGLAIGGTMVLAGTLIYSLAPAPKVLEGSDEKKAESVASDHFSPGVSGSSSTAMQEFSVGNQLRSRGPNVDKVVAT